MPPTSGKPKSKPKPTTNSAMAQEVLTLAEAAAYLRVPEPEVMKLIREQGLPARQIAQDYRILKEAIRGWLRNSPKLKEGILAHLGALKDDPHAEEMLREIHLKRGRPMTEVG